MSTVRYRDYQGAVEFEDGKLVIRILHIDDLITTEVEGAHEVQSAFAELVDDYLATCAEVGKEPARPFKGLFNVRVPPELHRQAAFAAAREELTLNSYVTAALEEKLKPAAPAEKEPGAERPDILFEGYLRLALVTCPIRLHLATEDGQSLEPDGDVTIEIEGFVQPHEIEPAYCVASYYLVPDGPIGHDAYSVIREAMAATKLIAIASLGPYTLALKPSGAGMIATLLRSADLVRDPSELFQSINNVKITKDMIDLATRIVMARTAAFDPSILKASPKKRRKIVEKQPKLALLRGDNVINLVEALRKSNRRNTTANSESGAPRRKA